MKYFDYYLKAGSKQHLEDSLISAELASKETFEDTEYFYVKDGVNLDIIGIIHKNMGTEEEPNYVEQPGYHANLRLKEQLSQEQEDNLPLITPPDTPVRVWA